MNTDTGFARAHAFWKHRASKANHYLADYDTALQPYFEGNNTLPVLPVAMNLDVETRWNSTTNMLKNALRVRGALELWHHWNNRNPSSAVPKMLTQEDWEAV
jgi:hypothetical protein